MDVVEAKHRDENGWGQLIILTPEPVTKESL